MGTEMPRQNCDSIISRLSQNSGEAEVRAEGGSEAASPCSATALM